MSNKRYLPALTALTLIAALAGCEAERAVIVENYPFTAPVLGGRPKPSPFVLETGNIKGIVHGKEGPGQPIGMAFVTTGSVSANAANPQPDQVEEDVDNNKAKAYVMKDFGDGNPVLVERRKREKPGGPNWEDKYVYLKPGEFFLEGVPDGIATLSASYGGVNSQQTMVEVYKSNTRADIKIPLYIPGPVQIENSDKPPNVVDFVGTSPETGISATVQIKVNDDGTRDITVDYKPNPPDINVYLKAPPGSAGTVIKGLNIVYSWSGIVSKKYNELEPIFIPISPIVVAPAQDTAYGPQSRITVPIGSALIQSVFGAVDPATNQPDPPPLIVCTMRFVDENGFEVLDKSFNPLEVATILRRL